MSDSDDGAISGTDDPHVDVHEGLGPFTVFEVEGKPDPMFKIQQVGHDPEIRYRYHWEDRGKPTPEDFERVGHVEVKLVGMMPDIEDPDVEEAADEAHKAIVELKKTMAEARGIPEGDDRMDLMLGNLDVLPEVEKR